MRGGLVAAATALGLLAFLYGSPAALGRYGAGVLNVYRNLNRNYRTYIFGHFFSRPPVYYYPCTILLKESMALLLGSGAGLFFFWRQDKWEWPERYGLLAPPAVLLAAALGDKVGVGLRRVLPIIPFLAVLCAVAYHEFAPRLRGAALWAGAIILFQIGSAAAAWPNYLSYFNPASRLAGEPLALLDESNLDWGQDLKALQAVLSARAIKDGGLFYFGSVDPAAYGVPLRPLPESALGRPLAGYYAVSAQYLIRIRALAPNLFAPGSEIARADEIYLFKK